MLVTEASQSEQTDAPALSAEIVEHAQRLAESQPPLTPEQRDAVIRVLRSVP